MRTPTTILVGLATVTVAMASAAAAVHDTKRPCLNDPCNSPDVQPCSDGVGVLVNGDGFCVTPIERCPGGFRVFGSPCLQFP